MQGGDLRHALAADDDDEFRWDCRGCEVAIDIARGLHFLHSAGVVHRCCHYDPGSNAPVFFQLPAPCTRCPNTAAQSLTYIMPHPCPQGHQVQQRAADRGGARQDCRRGPCQGGDCLFQLSQHNWHFQVNPFHLALLDIYSIGWVQSCATCVARTLLKPQSIHDSFYCSLQLCGAGDAARPQLHTEGAHVHMLPAFLTSTC
jgi:hypothetical protein